MKDMIEFICQTDLEKVFKGSEHFVFFAAKSDNTYVGIRFSVDQHTYEHGGYEQEYFSEEATIIFIDGVIWQYRFINVHTDEWWYISAEELISIIVQEIFDYLNG